MGWGTGGWGSSTWAEGATGPLTVVGAVAKSPVEAEVELSRAPLAASTIGAGDALNPASWSIAADALGMPLTILAVVQTGDPTKFSIFTLESFSAYPNLMRVTAAVQTANGRQVESPKFATFPGLLVDLAEAPKALVDIENPQFLTDLQPGGTLRTGADGDFANHSGVEFLRKLILRRLSTSPGGFFHMPDYGLGIQVKQPIMAADLGSLKAAIERQVRREPEFSAVAVGLTLDSDGTLLIAVRTQLAATNQEVVIPISVPSTGLISL